MPAGLNMLNSFTYGFFVVFFCPVTSSFLSHQGASDCSSVFESASSTVFFCVRIVLLKVRTNLWYLCMKWLYLSSSFDIFWQVKCVYSRCHVYRSVRVGDDAACFLSDVFLTPAFIKWSTLLTSLTSEPLPNCGLSESLVIFCFMCLNVYTWTLLKTSTFSSFTFILKRNTKAFICDTLCRL